MSSAGATRSQRLRCPCCGETFDLADAVPDEETTEAPPAIPAETQGLAPIKVVFDGGSIGNPGRGYGSYQLTIRGKTEVPKRLHFDGRYTNNEAEYDTLAAALEDVLRRAKDPSRLHVDIRGDSQLVIRQITGAWKAKEPRMQERKARVQALLARFGGWSATWHDRSKSVKALGH